MNVTGKSVLKYVLTPGLLPRARNLFGTGFSQIAYFMALAYQAVGLLPASHLYLDPGNIGKYRIRHVMVEARRHLVFDKKHIDQVVMYYTLMLGIFLMFIQFLAVLFALFIKGAQASGLGAYYASFFVTPSPGTDIAFEFMDRVFCLDGTGGAAPVFNSAYLAASGCPLPFHTGMHTLFQFYNLGLLGVAIIVFFYLATTTVAETAQTGIPFGRRFNKAITPIRLMLAVALLTPFAYGMNGAQHIGFRVAKWGSGLATNAWVNFTDSFVSGTSTLAGQTSSLVMEPQAPMLNNFHQFMHVVHTCRIMEEWVNEDRDSDADGDGAMDGTGVSVWHVSGQNSWPAPINYTFATALANAGPGNDIVIRFGVKNPITHRDEAGNVWPVCGEMTFRVQDTSNPASCGGTCRGAYEIQRRYFEDIVMFAAHDPLFKIDGLATAQRFTPSSGNPVVTPSMLDSTGTPVTGAPAVKDPNSVLPTRAQLRNDYVLWYQAMIDNAVAAARAAQATDPEWRNFSNNYGWAGAAIWYNTIAQLNGSMVSAAYSLPVYTQWPLVMEHVAKLKEAHESTIAGNERFRPYLSGGTYMDFEMPGDVFVAQATYFAQTMWEEQFEGSTGSPVVDVITAMFGLEGLFNMVDNVGVHPLAQLAGVGRSLVESAVQNLGVSIGTGVLGGLLNIIGETGLAEVSSGISKLTIKIAMIGLSIGFILYYILPFLPFVYFFFAVGGWVKGIFEAMVGLPLWALAHIQIDGEGIPGSRAMNGYFLLLEVFIRPILIVFGLIAAMSLFQVQVDILHNIWGLVVTNLAGADPVSAAAVPAGQSGAVDFLRERFSAFMYMIVYTIIVFMIGMGSFKMIDYVPDYILRWAGSSARSFNDADEDPAQTLVSRIYMGSKAIIGADGPLASLLGRN